MKGRRLALLFLIPTALFACTSLGASGPTLVPPTATPTPLAAANGVPSGVAACYFVWTTQELPALSQLLQNALQPVAAGASGSAYAYGEDCVSAEGSHTFTAMETDFRVRLRVTDLTNQKEMGDLIAAAMHVIDQIPKGQLVGPRAGRVDFEFYTASAGSLRLTVDIERFQREATNLSGARLFRLFYLGP